MPEYILMGDDLTVNFQLLKVLPYLSLKRQNGGLNGGLADRIILVIASNKAVTIAEISNILNIPKRTVEREIKNLRESERIRLHASVENDMDIGRLYDKMKNIIVLARDVNI